METYEVVERHEDGTISGISEVYNIGHARDHLIGLLEAVREDDADKLVNHLEEICFALNVDFDVF